jgi:hypothetical protein
MVSIPNEGVYTRRRPASRSHTDTPSHDPRDSRRGRHAQAQGLLRPARPPRSAALAASGAAPAPQPAGAASFDPPSAALTAAADAPQLAGVADPDAADAREKEAADKAAAEKPLSATSIAPNEVTRGRVYFARDKKSNLVNVVIPIAGLVFEFPYAMKH